MGVIYHAALENSLIMCFMDSRPWNAPLPVFCRLVDTSKMKSMIFKSRLKSTNCDSPSLFVFSSQYSALFTSSFFFIYFFYLFKCPKQQYMLCIYKLVLSYGIVWSRWPHLRMPLPLLQRWPLPLPLLHLGPLSQSQMTLVLPALLLRPWPKPKRSVKLIKIRLIDLLNNLFY